MLDIRDATAADVDDVYLLLDLRSRAAFGVSEVTRAHVHDDFARITADRWLASDAGRTIGYAHLLPTHDAVVVGAEPWVTDALLARVEGQARARGFDAIEITVVEEDEPIVELVRRSGFSPEGRVLRMWRTLDGDLPEPRAPDGIVARPYADADARSVHALLDDAYSSWDPHYEPLDHDAWLAFMTQHDDFDPALWFVAERDGGLVGCALHWREQQDRGWLKDLAVTPDERGRGLAKALVQRGFLAYAARGTRRVGLKVDATNPTGAPELYASLGFEVDRRYDIWRKPL